MKNNYRFLFLLVFIITLAPGCKKEEPEESNITAQAHYNIDYQWEKIFSNLSHGSVGSENLIFTNDGCIAIAFNWDNPQLGTMSVLAKLDMNLNIIFIKEYPALGIWREYLTQTQDDGYMLMMGYPMFHAKLLKTDATGNIQWQKSLSDYNMHYAYYFVEKPIGGYYIFGMTDQDILLLNLDSNGDSIGTFLIEDSITDFRPGKMDINNAGDMVLSYSYLDSTKIIGKVKTIDNSGNEIWSVLFYPLYGNLDCEIKCFCINNNNSVTVAINQYWSYIDQCGNYLACISSEGSLLWKQPVSHMAIHDVELTPDGGYLVLCWDDTYVPPSCLVKYDANGAYQWYNSLSEPLIRNTVRGKNLKSAGNNFILYGLVGNNPYLTRFTLL